jgi:uncharacterized protein
MTRRSRGFAALLPWLLFATAAAAQSPPPVPTQYVTDQAGVLPADAVARLNARLKDFDDQTSNQVLVAVFRALPPGAALEDYTVRTAQAWRAGRGKLDNGVVLFVFVNDRKVRLEVGYGLEGALPDITAHRIIDEQITPRFRAGDYAGGVDAAVTAIIAATKGEYKGEPKPATGTDDGSGGISTWEIIFIVIVLIIAIRSRGRGIYVGGGGFGGTFGGGGFSGGGGFGGGGGEAGGGGTSGGRAARGRGIRVQPGCSG